MALSHAACSAVASTAVTLISDLTNDYNQKSNDRENIFPFFF